jgi:pimeloyl-ACP methyl ester carboxylesterase
MTAKLETGHARVGNIDLYYEIHGSGEPLILLHGGAGAIEMFGPVLPALAATHRVIAVDLQAHGRTADIDRPLSFEAMADDIAGLVRHLGLTKADIMGYSLGGGVAIQIALRQPRVVHRLVVVSAPFKRDGWYPEVQASMATIGPQAAEAMKHTPMYEHYARIAPRPEDWPVLLAKLGDLLRTDYDWSRQVAAMKVPTLIVVGDADAVRPAHAVEFYGLLGAGQRDASRLAILPNQTHFTIVSAPQLATTVLPFLDGY